MLDYFELSVVVWTILIAILEYITSRRRKVIDVVKYCIYMYG